MAGRGHPVNRSPVPRQEGQHTLGCSRAHEAWASAWNQAATLYAGLKAAAETAARRCGCSKWP